MTLSIDLIMSKTGVNKFIAEILWIKFRNYKSWIQHAKVIDINSILGSQKFPLCIPIAYPWFHTGEVVENLVSALANLGKIAGCWLSAAYSLRLGTVLFTVQESKGYYPYYCGPEENYSHCSLKK